VRLTPMRYLELAGEAARRGLLSSGALIPGRPEGRPLIVATVLPRCVGT